ncbi:MAG: lipid A deacylase LpxR family protein [Gemmatimonadaceae bacterium]
MNQSRERKVRRQGVGASQRFPTLAAILVALLPGLSEAQAPRPASALVMTPANFSVLNPSIFGENSPAVLGGDLGHRPDARTYMFSGSLSHFRFQFGRTFYPQADRAKFLTTGVDYAHALASHALHPSLSFVSGIQGSVGYGVYNSLQGFGTEGVTVGALVAAGVRIGGSRFRLTPYVAPGYYFARTSLAGYACAAPFPGSPAEECLLTDDGYLFSFGGGIRLDLLNRLSLEAGVRKTQTDHAISRRSFGVSYRMGTLGARGLRDAGTFTLEMDNDFLGIGHHFHDEDYSQGFHLSYNRKKSFGPTSRVISMLGECSAEDSCVIQHTILAGQEIYTPRYYPSLEDNDRPFAGWLYGGTQSSRSTEKDFIAVSLKAGVTGPPSLARELQVSFHQLVPSYIIPPGWEDQLRFEPGVVASITRKALSELRSGPAAVGLLTTTTASLGNILTDVEGGLTIRAGVNAPNPWNFESDRHPFGLYASFGAREDLVVHSIFLDGNTFRRGPRVDRVSFVFQREWSMGTVLGRTSLEYRSIVRGREFTSRPRSHPYGTVLLTRRGAF